jgi:hypothetical protein
MRRGRRRATLASKETAMKIIAAVIVLAVALPAVAAPTPQSLLVGDWRSVDDARAQVEIKADGTWIDSYAGMPSATATSHWILFSGAHPPKDAADQTLDATSTYLEVSDEGGPLVYALDATRLELTYLARGNTLTYARMKTARPPASR